MKMIGADTQALRDLGAQFRSGSEQLLEIRASVGGRLGNTRWVGSDAEQFRGRWSSELQNTVTQVSQALVEAADRLDANAQAQDQTSADGGGLTGPGALGAAAALGLSGAIGGATRGSQGGDTFFNASGSFHSDGTSFSADGKASVLSHDESAKIYLNDGSQVEVRQKADLLFAEGRASGGIDENGAHFDASVRAGLLDAKTEATYESEYGTAHAESSAFVGAEGDLHAQVGPDGVEVDVGGFAGVRAEGEASIEAGGAKATAGGELRAGIGIDGSANFGVENGVVKGELEVGAALGIGGKVKISVEVNPQEVAKNVVNFFTRKWF